MCMKMNIMITLYTLKATSFCTNVNFFLLEVGVDDLFKSPDNKTTWKCVYSNALSSMGLTTSVRKVVCCT